MKKLIYTSLIIPLAFYSQEVFSASFNYGNQTYTTISPSSNFMKRNNQNLVNDTCEYNKQFKSEIKKPERSKTNTLDETHKNNTQHNIPSLNSERQTEPPSWWRKENSYEGWGFD